jgi:hypothetical protein
MNNSKTSVYGRANYLRNKIRTIAELSYHLGAKESEIRKGKMSDYFEDSPDFKSAPESSEGNV